MKLLDTPPPESQNGRPCLRRYPSLAWCLALGLLVLLVFGPGIWYGEIPWFMDTVGQFYPARVHAARLLAEGQLPLWNRTVFGGTAFLANPQWGLMYPGHWPFLALPTGHVHALTNAGHILLMALGMFFWLHRALGRGGLGAAALGAALSILGGWTAAHLAFGAYLQVGAWFPWMLWAWTRQSETCADSRKSARPLAWGALAGVFAAMQWLAGAPQLALYCLAGLWFYALVHGAMILRKRALLPLALFLLPQAVVTLGLSAPQWMSTRAFLEECGRSGGLPLERVLSGALDYKGLLRAWIGGTGSPENAEQILYPGLVSLFLAAIGLVGLPFKRREGASLLPVRIAAGALLLVAALSCYRPVARVLYHVLPMFDHFHDPMRALFLGYVATLALAALGFQELWRVARNTGQRHAQALFDAGLMALALAALVDVMDFSKDHIDTKTIRAEYLEQTALPARIRRMAGDGPPRFLAVDHGLQFTYNYTRSDFADSLLPGLSPLHGLEDIQGYDPAIPWRYGFYVQRANTSPTPTATLYPSHFGIFRNLDSLWLKRFGKLAAVGPARHHWPLQQARWLGPGEKMRIDLRQQARPWNTTSESLAGVRIYLGYVRSALHDGPPADILRFQFLSAHGERLAGLEAKGLDDPQSEPGSGWLWADVLPPDQWDVVPEGLEVVPAHRAHITSATLASEAPVPAAFVDIQNPHAAMGVLFYSIGLPDESIPFEPMADDDLYASTWMDGFPDRVLTVRSPATLPDSAPPGREVVEAYQQVAARFSPAVTTIELPDTPETPAIPPRLVRDWRMVERRANRLRIIMGNAAGAGWLVLAEPYQRGWTCRIDGRSAPVYPADTLFRAIPVHEGAAEIVLTYWPPALTAGLLIALASLCFACACFLFRKNRSSTNDLE